MISQVLWSKIISSLKRISWFRFSLIMCRVPAEYIFENVLLVLPCVASVDVHKCVHCAYISGRSFVMMDCASCISGKYCFIHSPSAGQLFVRYVALLIWPYFTNKLQFTYVYFQCVWQRNTWDIECTLNMLTAFLKLFYYSWFIQTLQNHSIWN